MHLLHAVERHLPAGFTIREQLGAGATSWVYLASRPDDATGGPDAGDHRIVVKVMQSGTMTRDRVERFLREMRILQKLRHPHIVPLLDPGEVEGAYFYTMPYVEGGTLGDAIRARGPLPVDEALGIALDVAEALRHAHSCGVVHRDVKPDNILLDSGGAYLIDFGHASAPSLTSEGNAAREAGHLVGTPDYVSPEAAAGKRAGDWRGDFYSLGCVLFEMLAGRPPFAGGEVRAVIRRRIDSAAPDVRTLRPDVPDTVAAIVRRCLERSPNDRFPTAGFLCSALRAARGPAPV